MADPEQASDSDNEPLKKSVPSQDNESLHDNENLQDNENLHDNESQQDKKPLYMKPGDEFLDKKPPQIKQFHENEQDKKDIKLPHEMKQDNETSQDNETPPHMFSVWVKMEVDEDGYVEGIEQDQDNMDPDYEAGRSFEPASAFKGKSPRKRTPRKAAPLKPQLKCDFCEYRTVYKNSLKFHMMDHTNPKPLSCEQCDYTTKYPNSLQRHIIGQHKVKENALPPDMPQFKCTQCDYSSIFKGNLEAHKRKHALIKNYKCDKCNFSTAYQHSYKKHCKVHQEKVKVESNITYQCDKCPFFTKHKGHITRHLAQIHKEVSEKANKCQHCEFSTIVRWRLNVHVNRSKQTEPIRCEFCDFVTEYHCAYKMHRGKHFGLRKAGDAEIIEVRPDYQPEIDISVPPPPINTKNLFLLDAENVEIDWRSIEVAENQGDDKPFQCTQCDFKARFKASVQRHYQRLHTSNEMKPYKCMNCDFATKTRDQISLHAKRSQSNILLRCNKCEFSTYFKCQHVMHQKAHYPFKCKLCSYTSRVNYDVHRHFWAVHLGNGLQCRFCDYKSSRKESLLNHETTHTGVKPFKCGQCDYSALRRALLLGHIKKKHYDKDAEPVVYNHDKIESLKQVNNPMLNASEHLSDATGFMMQNLPIGGGSDFEAELKRCYEMNTSESASVS